MKKKVFSTLLAVCMFVSFALPAVWAATVETLVAPDALNSDCEVLSITAGDHGTIEAATTATATYQSVTISPVKANTATAAVATASVVTITVKPDAGYEVDTFIVSNDNTAKLTADNTYTIAVRDTKVNPEVSVTFKEIATVPVESISLDQTKLSLEVGKSKQLIATLTPNTATSNIVTWSSSDNAIATVLNGNVTAVATGNVIITAAAGGKTATCAITVISATDNGSSGGSTDNSNSTTTTVTDTNNTGVKVEIPSTVTNVQNPELNVTKLAETSEMVKKFKTIAKNFNLLATFEIDLFNSNVRVTQVEGGKIKVSIPFAAGKSSVKYCVLRLNNDNTITKLEAKFADGNIVFETDHFSTYAIATEKTSVSTNPQTGDANPSLPIAIVLFTLASATATVLVIKKAKAKAE